MYKMEKTGVEKFKIKPYESLQIYATIRGLNNNAFGPRRQRMPLKTVFDGLEFKKIAAIIGFSL